MIKARNIKMNAISESSATALSVKTQKGKNSAGIPKGNQTGFENVEPIIDFLEFWWKWYNYHDVCNLT